MKRPIYLDYAAATPLDPAVLKAMTSYFTEHFYNPSATYLAGQAARRVLDQARAEVAGWLGAKPAEIIFTAGATEANNLAIQGVMRQYPKAEVLVSPIEHESVLAPAGLFTRRLIPVDSRGLIDLEQLTKLITDKVVLVSVMQVSNELGTAQSLSEISNILRKIRNDRKKKTNSLPLLLHSDAAQAANLFDLHVSRLGVDMLSLNGGKIYGPKQAGILYINSGVSLQPLILGGGQERNLRSGTENLAGAVGLARALELAQTRRAAEAARLKSLREYLITELEKIGPRVSFNGPSKQLAPHILSVTFAGMDNERLMIQLDEAGVMVAVGSACSAADQEPSHVLKAIGLSDEQARATLRFSFGRQTTKAELTQTVKLLKRFL